ARADHARAVSPAAEVVTELGTGALVWAGFDGEQVPGPILDAIRAGKIGGLLLFAFRGNIRSKDQVRAMVREAQEAAVRGDLPPCRSRSTRKAARSYVSDTARFSRVPWP